MRNIKHNHIDDFKIVLNESIEDIEEEDIYDEEEDLSEDDYDDRAEALAHYLGIEPSEITNNYNDYFETDDGYEYRVFRSYEEAELAAKDSFMDLIDDIGADAINFNNIGGIEQYADSGWFDEAQRESYQYYIDDIREESSNSEDYESRLEEEMADANCDNEEQFLDYLCSRTSDSIQWYIDEFGEREFNDTVKNKQLIDWDAVWEVVVKYDGIGGNLASYDGEELELKNGYYAYRTN